MRQVIVITALGWAALSLSCSPRSDGKGRAASDDHSQSNNPVLAAVGGQRITLRDFQAELARRLRVNPQACSTREQRETLLQEMVRFEATLAQARAAGYDRKAEVQAQVKELIVARFQQDRLAKESTTGPSEAEARQFYAHHPERFRSPAAARFAVIYFSCSPKATEEKRQEIRRKAETVLTAAGESDAASFSRLALQHSDDQSTRYAGGDAGWIPQDAASSRWDAAVVQAAYGPVEPGALAPLVETPGGFYIVRLLERRSSSVRPFDQVKEAIAYELAQQKRYQQQRDLFEEMKRGLQIEMNPEAPKLIAPTERTAETAPPPLPSS